MKEWWEWKEKNKEKRNKKKRHDERLKEKIGGWEYKWRNSAPLVQWFCIKPYSFLLLTSLTL